MFYFFSCSATPEALKEHFVRWVTRTPVVVAVGVVFAFHLVIRY